MAPLCAFDPPESAHFRVAFEVLDEPGQAIGRCAPHPRVLDAFTLSSLPARF
jgi:hypothetical protein